MSRRTKALAAATVLLAAAPALAYVRSTDDGTGACFYWGPRQVPYVINAPGAAEDGALQASCGAGAAVAAVRAGFEEWSAQTCTDLALVETVAGSASTQVGYLRSGANENLVVFRRGWCRDAAPDGSGDPCLTASGAGACDTVHNCFDDRLLSRSTIALTTVTYSPSSGQIFDADMELNAWDGASGTFATTNPSDGWYFSCLAPLARTLCGIYGQDDCNAMDLQNTVTHEAGHFIGLAHPCEVGQAGNDCTSADAPTTMYPRANLGEYSKRDLDADDRQAVCDVYPAGAATLRCTSSSDGDGSGCGCGTATPTGALATLLGLAALAPRLRRLRRRQDTTTPA